MAYKARWGPMGFVTSPQKIVPFENFSTSISLKADDGNDTSGTAKTNKRGLEPQPMTFTTKYMRALGVDPRERLDAWTSQIGKAYPFYIGNQRLGPAKMMLTSVNVSELITSNDGEFVSITLDITLKDEAQQKNATSSASSSKSSSGSSSASKAAATYQKTVEKKKAMQATASASDRTTKKLTAKEKRLAL